MRSSKSRSRSKANRPRTLGNIINRVFDSSGPEGKVRGTPQQIIEKYQTLARDAQLSNDRVAAENFLQHAEHYTRLLAEAMREMAAEQESRQGQNAPYQGGHNNNGGSYQGQPQGNWNAPQRSHDPRGDSADGEQPYIQSPMPESSMVDLPEGSPPPPRKFEPRPPRQNNDQRGPDRRNERRDTERKPQNAQLRFEDGAGVQPPAPVAKPADAAAEPISSEPKAAPIFESPAAVVAQIADAPKPRAPRARKPVVAEQVVAEQAADAAPISDLAPKDETAL